MPTTGWPPIEEPELVRRLGLDHDAFVATYCGFLREVGTRPFAESDWELALGYPWARPAGSFALDGERAAPLDGAATAAWRDGRWPLLAIGSNGAPTTLTRKLAHLPEAERRVAVESGSLEGLDVVAAAFPTVYGSFAATLVPNPRATLRASLLWVTGAQLTALAWTETSYLLGRLDGLRFVPDVAGGPEPPAVLAFASRWGALTVDGEPCPLAALPADGRDGPGWSQEELLDHAAGLVLCAGARGRDLAERIFTDLLGTARAVRAALGPHARPLSDGRWTSYPG